MHKLEKIQILRVTLVGGGRGGRDTGQCHKEEVVGREGGGG